MIESFPAATARRGQSTALVGPCAEEIGRLLLRFVSRYEDYNLRGHCHSLGDSSFAKNGFVTNGSRAQVPVDSRFQWMDNGPLFEEVL